MTYSVSVGLSDSGGKNHDFSGLCFSPAISLRKKFQPKKRREPHCNSLSRMRKTARFPSGDTAVFRPRSSGQTGATTSHRQVPDASARGRPHDISGAPRRRAALRSPPPRRGRSRGQAGHDAPRPLMYNMIPDTAPIEAASRFPLLTMACTRTAIAFYASGRDNRQPATRPGRRARRTTQPARGDALCAPRQASRRRPPHSRDISRLTFATSRARPAHDYLRGGPPTGAPAIYPSRDMKDE